MTWSYQVVTRVGATCHQGQTPRVIVLWRHVSSHYCATCRPNMRHVLAPRHRQVNATSAPRRRHVSATPAPRRMPTWILTF